MSSKHFIIPFTIITVLSVLVFSMNLSSVFAKETISLSLQPAHWNDGVRAWLENDALPRFYETHPDVDVHVYYTTGDFMEHMLTLAAAGESPDVHTGGPGTFRFAYPLTRFVDGWEDIDDFLPVAVQDGQANGEQLSIPFRVAFRHFFYRSDVFEESGLSSDDPPATWSELLDATRRIVRYDGDQLVRYPILGSANFMWLAFYFQAGGTPGDIDLGWPMREPALQALEFMTDLFDTAYPFGGLTGFSSDNTGRFINGQLGIVWYNNVGDLTPVFEGVVENDIIRALPPLQGPHTKTVSMLLTGLMMGWNTIQPELAWELIKFLTEPDNMATYNQLLGGQLPPRISILQSGFDARNPVVRLVAPLIDHAVIAARSESTGMGIVATHINTMLNSAVFRRNTAPNAAVETLETSIRAAIMAATNE